MTRLNGRFAYKLGGGSRVYQMLPLHGPVETLRRLVMRPTDGLAFLSDHDAINISVEMIALDTRDYRAAS